MKHIGLTKRLTLMAMVAVLMIGSLLSVSLALAQQLAVLPCRFYGTVQVNGADVADGTEIQALIDGNVAATTTTETYSTYALVVAQREGSNYAGKTVTFMIGGLFAPQTAIWQAGSNIRLDLSAGTLQIRYAIWGNSTNTNALLWSGSGTKVTGNVDSNSGITMSGSNNAIAGTVYYASNLTISGSKDTFTSSQKVSPRPMPVSFALADYQTGGKEAVKAQNAGKYHLINGNFNVSTSGTVLDGLYYVKGNVGLSGSNIKGTFTIVAEGTISISGSGTNCTSYSGGLLFFANGSSLAISGSNGSLGGTIYVPTGQIAISGSGNKINGGLFGDKITLSGSNMVITAK